MVKMSDVAKLAGVSVATVSRVIRTPESVKEITREKVLIAIKNLNYEPNMIARQFRTNETRTIVVIVPDITNPFFSEVLRGIEYIAARHGYQVLLGDAENNAAKELSYIDLLKQRLADGMILLTARMNKEKLVELAETYPLVLACEYIEGKNIPTVSIDNISSARKITEHLVSLGHKRIAHITGPMDVILNIDRLKGYKQAISANGLDSDTLLIQEGKFTYESGYNQMIKLLSLENPPTAVFAANDEMAIGAVKAARHMGYSVPEDIAVVGFDNIDAASIFEPSITTIDQPKSEIGQKAMELLLEIIRDGSNVLRKQYVLNDDLIIRESCGHKSNCFYKVFR